MTRARGLVAAAALLLAGGGAAVAHWVPPEAIVAELNGPSGRALGVERAARDEKAPRLLIVRVGERWYAIPVARRGAVAADWLQRWRHNVAEGVVSVLDGRTDQPVVRFRGGRVAEVSPETPAPAPSHERGNAPP